jgi:hypothetical protein
LLRISNDGYCSSGITDSGKLKVSKFEGKLEFPSILKYDISGYIEGGSEVIFGVRFYIGEIAPLIIGDSLTFVLL